MCSQLSKFYDTSSADRYKVTVRVFMEATWPGAAVCILQTFHYKLTEFTLVSHIFSTQTLQQSFPVLPTCSQQVSRVFVISFDHTQATTTVGKTLLDEGSARRRDLYLTTQTLYKTQTSMPPVGFEPTIPASARLQTYVLDRAAAGIGWLSSNQD
jgi:hypothetical protein